MNVPVRKVEVFQTDDGRKVEVYTKISETASMKGSEKTEVSKENVIYAGVVHVGTPIGPKEIKFEIEGAKTLEEALNKYYDFANDAAKKLMEKFEEARKEAENQIVTAPAGALNEIDKERPKLRLAK
jgi:hypothetical protein